MRIRVLGAILVSVLFAAVAAAQSADLYVSKSGPGTATEGSNITYTVTVGNVGPDDAASASLTDTLPSSGTFVSESQSSGPAFTCSTPNVGDPGGTVVCTIATLAAGQSATFQITINAPSGTAGMTLIDSATITSDTPDNNTENNNSIFGTTIAGGDLADVAVNKTAPQSAAPGSNVTFTITVSDLGPNDALNVSLNDTLGAGLTFVSLTQTGGPTFTCNGGSTPCTIATLPNGSTATFQLVATVSNTSGTYSNTASVTSQNDQNPENDSSQASVIVASSDVGVVKSGPATAIAGGPNFSYTITLSNSGPDSADQPSFSDTLPAGITFVSLTQTSGTPPASGCTNPGVGQSGPVGCTLPFLANGTSTQFTLTVQASPTVANGTVATNVVTASSASNDPNPNNNSSSVATTISANADLGIAKNGPATVTAGNNATYTVTVTNSGPSTASSVQWVDPLPATTSFVSLTQNTGPVFTCTTGATVTCSIAALQPNDSATFTLVVSVSPAATGTVSNTATVNSTTPDTNTVNNTATSTATVVTSADLGVTKTGTTSANVGGQVTFNIGVTNAGPSNAATVTLTDVLPASLTFVSMNQTSGPTFACSGTSTVICTAATFPAGGAATFVLTATVNAVGTFTNTATVSSSTTDPNPSNNSASQQFSTLPVADLAVTKIGPTSASTGANASYTITVTNNGPSPAASVVLTDVIPANTTFVSMNQTGGTPAFACSGTTTVTCTAATMNSGESATFNLTVLVNAGPNVVNTATVSSATLDLTPANNSSTATTPVAFGANVPTLSPFVLALLALALALIALKR